MPDLQSIQVESQPLLQQPRRVHRLTHRQQSRARDFIVTGIHDRILKEALCKHHFLTALQITRLLYPTAKLGNKTTVQGKLKELTDTKYLHSFYLPLPRRQQPLCYCLGLQGKRYLAAEGMDTDLYYIPSEAEQKTYGTLMHTLEINDILISLRLLIKAHADTLTLFDMQHDLLLKRTPFTVMESEGKLHRLVPDALVEIRQKTATGADRRFIFWIELDRDNHSNSRLREQFRDRLLFAEKHMQLKYFHKESPIPYLYFTTGGDKRVEQMRALCRMELEGVPPGNYKNLIFKFASVPPLMENPLDSETIFTRAFWLSPKGDQQATLLDLSK